MYTNIIIITISITISGIITWIITRYYYLRNRYIRSLTPYKNFIARVFSDIDPELKKDLKIKYRGVDVDNFYQVQFTIINTGNRSLNNFIKPLTLKIPNNGEILDAKILYIYPEGREITLNIGPQGNFISYNIPLLNSGEYFVTKLLIKGDVEPNQDFVFRVTAEDLPPDILSSDPPIVYASKLHIRYIFSMVFMILVLIFLIVVRFLIKPSPFPNIGTTTLIIMYAMCLGFYIFLFIRTRLRTKKTYSEILKKFSK